MVNFRWAYYHIEVHNKNPNHKSAALLCRKYTTQLSAVGSYEIIVGSQYDVRSVYKSEVFWLYKIVTKLIIILYVLTSFEYNLLLIELVFKYSLRANN